LILVVGAIGEVAVSLIQIQSNVNVTISFLYYRVYCAGSGNARLYCLKSVGVIDMAANGRGVTAA
jgi:hypothetical protein